MNKKIYLKKPTPGRKKIHFTEEQLLEVEQIGGSWFF